MGNKSKPKPTSSAKTAREKSAAARAAAEAAEKRRQRTINIAIAAVVLLVVGGIVGGALIFSNQTKQESGAVVDPSAAVPSRRLPVRRRARLRHPLRLGPGCHDAGGLGGLPVPGLRVLRGGRRRRPAATRRRWSDPAGHPRDDLPGPQPGHRPLPPCCRRLRVRRRRRAGRGLQVHGLRQPARARGRRLDRRAAHRFCRAGRHHRGRLDDLRASASPTGSTCPGPPTPPRSSTPTASAGPPRCSSTASRSTPPTSSIRPSCSELIDGGAAQ